MNTVMAVETRSNIRFRHLDACPCCGAREAVTLLADGADFESGLGVFAVRQCSGCGIGFTTPQPLADDIHKLYDDRGSHDFDESSAFVSWLRRRNNFRQLRRLPREMRAQPITALDYGCGGGFFTCSMRAYLQGRIIASDFHATAPPLLARAGAIEYVPDAQLERLRGQLDVIICRNVLEHTVDPIHFLQRLRDLLRAGGVVLIEVPNRSSIWMKLMGRYAFNYYLPRHLYHYDAASLTRHLEGFRVSGLWRDHSPILGKSVGNLFGMKISGFGWLGLLLLPLQLLLDLPLLRSSQLVVVAERVG